MLEETRLGIREAVHTARATRLGHDRDCDVVKLAVAPAGFLTSFERCDDGQRVAVSGAFPLLVDARTGWGVGNSYASNWPVRLEVATR
jgi:hypothetical protein